jgi:hypothetical protein
MKFPRGILFFCIIASQVVVSTKCLNTNDKLFSQPRHRPVEQNIKDNLLLQENTDDANDTESNAVTNYYSAASNIESGNQLNQQNSSLKKNECRAGNCLVKKIKGNIVKALPYSEEQIQPSLVVHVVFNNKWTQSYCNARRPRLFKFSDYLALIIAFVLGSSVKACNQPEIFNKMDILPGFALSVIMTLISLYAFDYVPIIIRIFGHTIGKIIYCCNSQKAYENPVVLYGSEILTAFGMLSLLMLTQCQPSHCGEDAENATKHFKMNFSCPDWENLVGNFLAHCVKDPAIDACIFAMGLVGDAYLNQQKKINFTKKKSC